jgi:hypothetical protein
MSDEQYPPVPPPPPPVPSSQRFPTWKQALVMFLGGGALMISACLGCLYVGDFATEGSVLGFVATFLLVLVPVGLLAMFVGALLVLIRILHALFGRKDETPVVTDPGHLDD